jgi:Ankyrin repeats (3 copies)
VLQGNAPTFFCSWLALCKTGTVLCTLIALQRESMTPGQKQALVAASHPLTDTSILKQVFTFVPGCWLLLGGVCREWKAVYAGIADLQVRACKLYNSTELVTCGAKTTLFSAAVASPAIARLACESGLQICTDVRMQVVAGGHADTQTLTALRELGMPLRDGVVLAAAQSGRLNILQYLLIEQHCPRHNYLSYYAARSGSISMLNWLEDEALCELDQSTCTGAASAGQLAALKHLHNEGCDWDVRTIAHSAARGGSVEMGEWLQQQQGIVIDARVMKAAAGAGQIDMCKYLHSTGCEWNATVCYQAAGHGHVDTLRWLRENGCPWDIIGVLHNAARNRNIDVLELLIEQGEVLSAKLLTSALREAGVFDQLQAAQWLRQHGANWPTVLQAGGLRWHGESLAWARAEGCTSPTTTL